MTFVAMEKVQRHIFAMKSEYIGMSSVFHKLEAQFTCCIFLRDKEINIGQRHNTLSQFLWTLYTDHCMICMFGACTELESNDQVPVRTIAKLLGSKLLARLLSYTRWFSAGMSTFLHNTSSVKNVIWYLFISYGSVILRLSFFLFTAFLGVYFILALYFNFICFPPTFAIKSLRTKEG